VLMDHVRNKDKGYIPLSKHDPYKNKKNEPILMSDKLIRAPKPNNVTDVFKSKGFW